MRGRKISEHRTGKEQRCMNTRTITSPSIIRMIGTPKEENFKNKFGVQTSTRQSPKRLSLKESAKSPLKPDGQKRKSEHKN